MTNKNSLGKCGMVARFKPLHNGAAIVLEELCKQADEVIIGIGSANKYNLRNPFSADESEGMVKAFLSPRFSNYKIIHVPDFAQISGFEDGQKWKEYVKEKFGELDYFVSGNDFVRDLLKDTYKTIYPTDVLIPDQYVRLRATRVRVEMALFGDWQKLVPEEVKLYLESRGIVDRFRNEFGLATLANLSAENSFDNKEELHVEELHAREV